MLVSPCINTNVSGLQCGRRVAAFLYCLVKYGAEKTVCVECMPVDMTDIKYRNGSRALYLNVQMTVMK